MSWISENYEKVAIGGAAVAALAIGALVFSSKDAVDEATVLPENEPDNGVVIAGLPDITNAKDSFGAKHAVDKHTVDGDRKVNLFTGIPLFAKKGAPKSPVDLLKSNSVHSQIPNTWWLEHRLDPGMSDSPDKDPDGDGFSNREEYVAQTDPNDEKSHPDPISKITVVGVKTTQVHVRPSNFGGGQYIFRLQTKTGVRIGRMKNPIKAGEDINFEGDFAQMNNRFKFLRVEQKQIVKNGINQNVDEWVIEDKKPNKAKDIHRVDRRGNPGILDSTVEFNVDAMKQDGKTFKVEENTRFSLPFDEAAKEKPYLLKKTDRKNKKIEIEYTDKTGNKKSKILDFQ